MTTATTLPHVSVIVPTRNSAETLGLCLESITQQSHPSIELIVVDNQSSDSTLEISQAYTDKVFTRGPERSAQRNYGAGLASGQLLLFIDSDMVLSRDVVSACVATMGNTPGAGGIIIPERTLGKGYWARCKALERSCYVGDDAIEAARCFHRDVFGVLGGYDEALTGPEDWDLSQRAALLGKLVRVSEYITHLEGGLTLLGTMRSKFYYGKTMHRYIAKGYAGGARRFSLIRPAFLRAYRRLIAQPHLAAGILIIKACEGLAGVAGLVTSLRE
jgi:glycosyltransferase involved in cell wall biosynthesis